MADRKITELTELSAGSQATGDLLTVVDVSETATESKNKKITVDSLFKGIPGDVGVGVTSPTTKLDVNGDVTITEKIIHSGDTNTHISFAADDTFAVTTAGTERIRVLPTGGLTFGGDTADANALSDYEEGTFTPNIVGTTVTGTATYTSRTGIYTKVGNQVSFVIECTWTSLNGIGPMKITGLPETSKAGVDQPVSALSASLNLGASFGETLTFHAMVLPSSTEIKLYGSSVNATTKDDVTIDAAATIHLAGTYLAST